MMTASIHTLGAKRSTSALTIDPDPSRLALDDHADLLRLWRDLVRGHFVDPKALAGPVLTPWAPNLLVSRRLHGPLRFDITMCGPAIASAISRSAKGRLLHDLIAEQALPRTVFDGLQQCIDRACPIHQTVDANRGAEALHLPVGHTGRLPSHILTHIAGLDGSLAASVSDGSRTQPIDAHSRAA